MRRRRWLIALPLSTALHALGVIVLLWLVWQAAPLPALFVDLSTLDLESPAASASGDRPAARGAGRRGAPTSGQTEGGFGARGRVLPRTLGTRATTPPPTLDTRGADTARAAAPQTETSPAPSSPPAREDREEAGVPVTERTRPPAATSSERTSGTTDPSAGAPAAVSSHLVAPGEGSAPESSVSRSSEPGGSRGRGPGSGGMPGPTGIGRGAGSDGGGRDQGGGGSALISSGGAGARNSEYGPYLAMWRRRIHENLQYPLAARRRGLTGTVQIEIVIQANGAVAKVHVAESSSHGLLDEAAMEAVRGLPALPFPSHLAPRPLRARLPIVFDLQ